MRTEQKSITLGLIGTLMIGTFVLDLLTPLGVAVWLLYLVPVVLTVWVGDRRASFIVATICGALTIAGFVLSPPGDTAAAVVNRATMIVTLAVISTLVLKEKQGREHLEHEIVERIRAQDTAQALAATLEQRVAGRTEELVASQAAAVNLMKDAEEARRQAECAEEDARRSEAFIASIVENIPHMIFLKDATNLRFVRLNKAAEDMIGVSRDELIGKNDYDLFPKQEADQYTAKDREALEAGRLVDIPDESIHSKLHGLRILHTKKIPLLDGTGRPRYLLGISEDITERKRAEEDLRASEMRTRLLLESTGEGIYGLDAQGHCTFINKAAARMLGCRPEEVLGRNMHALFHHSRPDGSRYPREECHIDRAFRTGTACRREDEMFWRPDGTAFPVEYFASPIFDHAIVTGVVITFTDITERKQAAEELAKQTAILQSVLNSVAEGVVVADLNGNFVIWNAAAERLLGRGAADLPTEEWSEHYGVYLADQVTLCPPDRLPLVRAIRGESVDGEELFHRHAQAPMGIWLSVTGRPLKDHSGVQRGGVVVFGDVTERKRAEAATKLHAAQLEAANSELEAFSYSVSHDLRAPIRHIDGFVDLLQKYAGSALDDKSKRYVTTISQSAKQMGRLIDDLLVFSRMGRSEIRRGTVNLDHMVKDVIEELHPDLQGRQIAWSVSPLPDVEGDAAMLRQVFANLIGNAVKYTGPRTQARIEIGVQDGHPNETVIFVRDNGVGFDMQYAHKLFGVFQRLHTVNEFEGTGIGLANVRRIITRHGGRTWADGSLGEGATFYVSLPQWGGPYDSEGETDLVGGRQSERCGTDVGGVGRA